MASYPLSPLERYSTFLIDLHVMPGNSGSPVFMEADAARHADGHHSPPLVTGVLIKELELQMGVVAPAAYVRETAQLLDAVPPSARRGDRTARSAGQEGK